MRRQAFSKGPLILGETWGKMLPQLTLVFPEVCPATLVKPAHPSLQSKVTFIVMSQVIAYKEFLGICFFFLL